MGPLHLYSSSLTVLAGSIRLHVRHSTQQVATDGMRAEHVTDGIRQLVLRLTLPTATLLVQLKQGVLAVERSAPPVLPLLLTALSGQQVLRHLVRHFLTLRLRVTQSQPTQFT
jgi:hypothetical protein